MKTYGALAVALAAILGTGVVTIAGHGSAVEAAPRAATVAAAPAAVAPSSRTDSVAAHEARPHRAAPAVKHRRSAPVPAVRVASRPKAAATARPKSTHKTAAPAASAGPTSWPALNAAIARIPTYSGGVTWVVRDTGYWGTADWNAGIIYVSRSVPDSKLYDVAVHEWSHILSVRAYGGNVAAAVAAMTAFFGGTGLNGAEDAADCMAILQGATWTNYTSCSSARWRAGAKLLVEGRHLS